MLDGDQADRLEWLEMVTTDPDIAPQYSLAQQERLQRERDQLREKQLAKPIEVDPNFKE